MKRTIERRSGGANRWRRGYSLIEATLAMLLLSVAATTLVSGARQMARVRVWQRQTTRARIEADFALDLALATRPAAGDLAEAQRRVDAALVERTAAVSEALPGAEITGRVDDQAGPTGVVARRVVVSLAWESRSGVRETVRLAGWSHAGSTEVAP